MTESFDHLLTGQELQRFDQALDALRQPEEIRLDGSEKHPLTPYEEWLWLYQQQFSNIPLVNGVAFRLLGELDVGRLISAIQDALERMPELNVRFRFDADEGLQKHYCGRESPISLDVQRIDSTVEIGTFLQARLCRHWDLELEAPIRPVLLLKGPEENLFAVISHRILDESALPEQLLRALSEAFNTRPARSAATHDIRPYTPPVDAVNVPIDWLLQPIDSVRIDPPGFLNSPIQRLPASQWNAAINEASLTRLMKHPLEQQTLLALVAVLFGRYVAHLSGQSEAEVTVFQMERCLPHWHGAEQVVMTVTNDQDGIEAQVRSLSSRLKNTSLEVSSRSAMQLKRPQAFAGWINDPADFMPLDDIVIERWPLPVSIGPHDLMIRVGRNRTKQVLLELSLGQALSSQIGGFLLERFVAYLHCGELPAFPAANGLPLEQKLPSAASPTSGASIAAVILNEFRLALSSPDMGLHDDFFDWGGHSLIATRVIGRLLSLHGIEIHFNDLFSHSTAAGLAAKAIRPIQNDSPPSIEATENTSLTAPLSLAQQSLWKPYAAFGFGQIFNISLALRFLDPVDEDIFGRAFQDILERHSALRTLFVTEKDDVYQHIVPIAELHRYQWFWRSDEGLEQDRHREAAHRFDLSKELPLRIRFIREPSSEQQTLSLLFHHIVLDEWSVNLMMDELNLAYAYRQVDLRPVWNTQPRSFHEYALLQSRAGVNQAHLDYWLDELRGAPRFLPPFQHADKEADRPSSVSTAGTWVEIQFDSQICGGLHDLARKNAASLFNVVYAAIAATLHFLGSVDDLVIGTSASGRHDPTFFDTIGYFTTVVAHRIRFSETLSLAALISQVKNNINSSMPYTDIPIDLVEEALTIDTAGEKDHMFDVFIQLHAKNKLNGALCLQDGRKIEFRQIDPEKSDSLLGLQFEVLEELIGDEPSIRILMSYRADRYGPSQVEAITRMTEQIFGAFSQTHDASVMLASLRPDES